MKKIKVLYGFDYRSFEKEVTTVLNSLGYEVESIIKISKTSIHDFLEAHEDYDAAVLLEVMNKSKDERVSRYTAEELAMLTDNRNINIVVMLNKGHYATPFMEMLYTAGITSAIFQEGRKGGATAKEVVDLLLHPRSRREARTYYGLQGVPLSSCFLGKDSCEDYMKMLFDINYGDTVIERFLTVCNQMSRKQVLDFIRRLSSETLQELRKYEEFYIIIEELQAAGAKIDIHRPKGRLRTLDNAMNEEPEKRGTAALPDKDTPIILERPDVSVIEEECEGELEVAARKEYSETVSRIPDFSEMLQMAYMDEMSEEEQIAVEGENRFDSNMIKELQELRKWKSDHEPVEEKTMEMAEDEDKEAGKRRKVKKTKEKNTVEDTARDTARKREKILIPLLMVLGSMSVLVITIGIIILLA